MDSKPFNIVAKVGYGIGFGNPTAEKFGLRDGKISKATTTFPLLKEDPVIPIFLAVSCLF
jgi:hypothetical protein